MKTLLCGCTCSLLLWFGPSPLLAQDYRIDWFTIDGGGGTSTGGPYSLSGTIGQPDAGTMSSAQYTLVGGFWGAVHVIQTPNAPLLQVTRSGPSVIVSWPLPADGWILEEASALPALPDLWTSVSLPYATNATHISVEVPAPTGTKYYRLRF